MTTTELIVKKGPSKLDLMLALFDKDDRGPRFVSFHIEGELYKHLKFGEVYEPRDTLLPKCFTRKGLERIEKEPYVLHEPQWMGATVDSVTRVFGEEDTWEVIGTTQGKVSWEVNRGKEDVPFRAHVSTQTRKGKIWFEPPKEPDPMAGLRG